MSPNQPFTRRAILATAASLSRLAAQTPPLRLALAGLEHGHASGFLRALQSRSDVTLSGMFDPSKPLLEKYAKQFKLEGSPTFTNLDKMLDDVKPAAVATFTSTYDHVAVVRACAKRKIPVMMEKPLAVSNEHAREIAALAHQSGIPVMVNYETTWYRSHHAMWDLLKHQKAIGDVRKMVAMDGHQGPKEIGVGPEFFNWLTDPVKNGAGALFDFGCYGANLMTWMMDNQRPLSVTARVQHIKPHIYAKVDDEANILVEYPKAIGIIEGSWNWPFSRKDFELYAETGYAQAIGGNVLKIRRKDEKEEEITTPHELNQDIRDSVSHLSAITRGVIKAGSLSSLENNLIVTEILVAARESAKTGRTVKL